jgi:hypothetical protein
MSEHLTAARRVRVTCFDFIVVSFESELRVPMRPLSIVDSKSPSPPV